MNIRVFTSFSGYDSQCMALDRLHAHNPDFGYELVGWSEIDKYAIAAHNAVYPQWADRNYGDISKIDWEQVPDFDLFTYSSPCQDFSQAGKQAGGTEGSEQQAATGEYRPAQHPQRGTPAAQARHRTRRKDDSAAEEAHRHTAIHNRQVKRERSIKRIKMKVNNHSNRIRLIAELKKCNEQTERLLETLCEPHLTDTSCIEKLHKAMQPAFDSLEKHARKRAEMFVLIYLYDPGAFHRRCNRRIVGHIRRIVGLRTNNFTEKKRDLLFYYNTYGKFRDAVENGITLALEAASRH